MSYKLLIVLTILAVFSPFESIADLKLESKSFDYKKLRNLIDSNKIKSLDNLLPKLPEDCRSHFVLVYKSRSLQFANETKPRTILYCDGGRLILAFSGDSSKPRSNILEIISFNEANASFELKMITFLESENQTTDIMPEKKVAFDENPLTCLGCHRDQARPNFDSYNLWPGMYGSEEDHINIGSKEDKNFRDFLKEKEQNSGRFSSLIGLKTLKDVEAVSEKYYFPSQNSITTFNALVSKLNFERIVKIIKKSNNYQKYKYAILASITNCSDIESFIPNLFKEKAKENYKDILKDTQDSNRNYVINKFKQHEDSNRGSNDEPLLVPNESKEFFNPMKKGLNGFNFAFAEPIAKLRYVMALQGIDIENWFLTKDEGSYTFDDGGFAESQLVARLAAELFSTDPGLKQYFEIKSENYGEEKVSYIDSADKYKIGYKPLGSCDFLKEKSLSAFKVEIEGQN